MYGEPSFTPSNYVTIEPNSLLRVQAASAGWYKVVLPDGSQGYITSNSVNTTSSPLRKITASAAQPLYDAPSENAARKMILEKGDAVNLLASFKDFYFVSAKDEEGWILKATVGGK